MHDLSRFFTLLVWELHDVEEDLNTLVQVYEQRGASGELSPYVYRNNIALFKRELDAVKQMIHELNAMCCADFGSLKEAEESVLAGLRDLIHDSAYPEVVLRLITRKAAKIRRFLEDET